MRTPDATCEVAIVGAGVVGCALAWQLARAKGAERVVLLEQAEREGTGISSRNSGVVHAGLYYAPGSTKARACVEGNARLWDWVARQGVGHRRTGKLVIASDEVELAALERLASNASACGAEVELVDAARARALEPELRVDPRAALWSPSSGIVDAHAYVRSLRLAAEREGASVLFGAEVVGIAARGSSWWIESTRGSLLAERVINAAGLHADAIAAMVGVERTIIPARGDYFRLRRPRPWSRLIYPVQVPGSASLGVHLTLELEGGCRLGPDLDWTASKHDFSPGQGEAKREQFRIAAQRLLGELADDDLVYDGCGIRPKLVGPGASAADFEVFEQPPGVRHYLGIESPGLTAALALV
ncbi:NAD(P)/FAD-dependent oxidoreductase [Nannocystaceae bacterium ST9]